MKVTITLEDNAEGAVDISTEFDPPADDNTKNTMASHTALFMLHALEELKAGGGHVDEP